MLRRDISRRFLLLYSKLYHIHFCVRLSWVFLARMFCAVLASAPGSNCISPYPPARYAAVYYCRAEWQDWSGARSRRHDRRLSGRCHQPVLTPRTCHEPRRASQGMPLSTTDPVWFRDVHGNWNTNVPKNGNENWKSTRDSGNENGYFFMSAKIPVGRFDANAVQWNVATSHLFFVNNIILSSGRHKNYFLLCFWNLWVSLYISIDWQ